MSNLVSNAYALLLNFRFWNFCKSILHFRSILSCFAIKSSRKIIPYGMFCFDDVLFKLPVVSGIVLFYC